MMRQRAKFCKLISHRADGDSGGKMRAAVTVIHNGMQNESGKSRRGGGAQKLFSPEQVGNFTRNRKKY
jgi:hypothetical protein